MLEAGILGWNLYCWPRTMNFWPKCENPCSVFIYCDMDFSVYITGIVSLGVVMLIVKFDRPYAVAVNTSIRNICLVKALSYNSSVYYITNLTGPIYFYIILFYVYWKCLYKENTHAQLVQHFYLPVQWSFISRRVCLN